MVFWNIYHLETSIFLLKLNWIWLFCPLFGVSLYFAIIGVKIALIDTGTHTHRDRRKREKAFACRKKYICAIHATAAKKSEMRNGSIAKFIARKRMTHSLSC